MGLDNPFIDVVLSNQRMNHGSGEMILLVEESHVLAGVVCKVWVRHLYI